MPDVTEQQFLKTGESLRVTMTSRGALGLQLLHKTDNDSAVRIVAEAIAPDAAAQAGDAMPAIYSVTALKPGICNITFYETQPWNAGFEPIVRKMIHLSISER